MTVQDIIEEYRDVVIQIATPYSTGTGFYIEKYNLIVTNEHVVRDNKTVVIDGEKLEKQLTQVVFVDPMYDLAFLQTPKVHKMPSVEITESMEFNEGDSVIATGHPFGLKFTATRGILSNLNHKQKNITYFQHDAALNPGNSGGPLVDLTGKIIGVNTFIIRDGNNIGFSLPVGDLVSALEEFCMQNNKGVRCNSCANMVFENKVEEGYCPHCGSKITVLSDLDEYEAAGINKSLEELIEELGHTTALCRKGPSSWEIKQGTADINISYYEKTGLIVGDAYLCRLPKKNIEPLYTYLLRQNYDLGGLTFSVKDQRIILSLLIYDQYFDKATARKYLERLFQSADRFDNLLIRDFGAIAKINVT